MALPLDQFGYALTGIVTVVMQLLFFAIAYGCNFDLVTDFAGSSNFVLIALLTIALGPDGFGRVRPLTLTALLMVTRLELAAFLLYRVCKRKKDARFDETRSNFLMFLCFWIFQMLWAWFVSLPVIYVNSTPEEEQPNIGVVDIIGWLLFTVGFLAQVLADLQKYSFRADPANHGRFCDLGIWKFSRHPNYFGEIAMWWGIWLSTLTVVVAAPADRQAAGWATLLGPLWTMVILLFVSGLPTAEGKALARYYENETEARRWKDYRARTSPVVPMPCAVYSRLPRSVRRWLLCEFSFLEYPDVPSNPGGVGNSVSVGAGSSAKSEPDSAYGG